MPSDSKKKREQKKKEAAKKRDTKKPTSACDATTDSDAATKLTDDDVTETVNGDQPESCNGAEDGKLCCHLCVRVTGCLVMPTGLVAEYRD